MKRFIICTYIFLPILVFSNGLTDDLVSKQKETNNFENEKVTYVAKKRFDKFWTSDITDFYFFKGKEEISFSDFIKLSNDPIFDKNNNMIRRIKINGALTGGIFGVAMVGSIIPSAILINNALSYNMIELNYFMSGIVCVIAAVFSGMGLIMDIIITFTLYQRYKFNEHIVRNAVENYNKKLKEKYKLLPDFSIRNDNSLYFHFKINI